MIKPENYSQCPELIPARCYKASQRVIYTDKYIEENEALQKCINMAHAIGHEEWQLLEKALGHKDAIMYMFEEPVTCRDFMMCLTW